jgi:hypothetical protein
MTWKEAFKEVKEDMDLNLPDGSKVELLYPTMIFAIIAIVSLLLIC